MKYRKRPIIVEASRWFPGTYLAGVHREEPEETIVTVEDRGYGRVRYQQEQRYYVVTIHGQRAYLEPGDWVIAEPDGIHHYPCKPAEFERIYEPAEASR